MTQELKPGFYRCRDGSRAEVFKEADGKLWGRLRLRDGSWSSEDWDLHGCYMPDHRVYRVDLVAPWQDEPKDAYAELRARCIEVGLDPNTLLRRPEELLEQARPEAVTGIAWISYDPERNLRWLINTNKVPLDEMRSYRRITFTLGKVMGREDLCQVVADAYLKESKLMGGGGNLMKICEAFLEAWKQGRCWDSTPEDKDFKRPGDSRE